MAVTLESLLNSVPDILKPEVEAIREIIKANNITCLYHITSAKNIPSIERNGIISELQRDIWGVKVGQFASSSGSRYLEKYKGWEDYICLSFRSWHRMLTKYQLENSLVEEFYIIEVDPLVLYLEKTVFCDRNGISRNCLKGPRLSDFQMINFELAMGKRVAITTQEKELAAAEVRVLRNIKPELILKIYKKGTI